MQKFETGSDRQKPNCVENDPLSEKCLYPNQNPF